MVAPELKAIKQGILVIYLLVLLLFSHFSGLVRTYMDILQSQDFALLLASHLHSSNVLFFFLYCGFCISVWTCQTEHMGNDDCNTHVPEMTDSRFVMPLRRR